MMKRKRNQKEMTIMASFFNQINQRKLKSKKLIKVSSNLKF